MPQPNDYTVPQVNALGAYKAGQQMRQQDDQQNALQQYLPQAIQGDTGAIGSLAATGGPNLQLMGPLLQHAQSLSDDQKKQAAQDAMTISRAFEGVDVKTLPPDQIEARRQAAAAALSPDAQKAFLALPASEIPNALMRAQVMPGVLEAQRAAAAFADEHLKTVSEIGKNNAQASQARAAAAAPRGGAANMSPAAIAFTVDRLLAGDKSAIQNIGRGTQGAANIAAIQNQLATTAAERGISGAQLASLTAELGAYGAGQRTAAVRSANIQMAGQEFLNISPTLRAAADNVNLSDYTDVNQILNLWRSHTGDPNITRLGAAMNAAINTYSRAVSPSGTPTVHDKEEGIKIMNLAMARGQIDAGLDQMEIEINAALESPVEVRQKMHDDFLAKFGQGKAPAPATASSGRPKIGTEKGGYRYMGGDPSLPSSWKKK